MKKKGFTLIELLAVIVILAIIALIATPLVLKYIENSRKGAFENTIESIERVAELKIMDMQTKGNVNYPLELDVKDLDLKNKEKLNGAVTVEKDANNQYKYTYDVTDRDYKIYGSKESEVYKLDKTVKLKLKTANGVIDDDNNLVYSFYNSPDNDYKQIGLENYFEAENGTLEFKKNKFGNDSTGSKIILKDKNDKVMKVYTVTIFGDVNASGHIESNDAGIIQIYIRGDILKGLNITKVEKLAADINQDGIINDVDATVIEDIENCSCQYNQITNVCEAY